MNELLNSLARQMVSGGITYGEAVREFKKRFILAALTSRQGNQVRTAKAIQLHRNSLGRMIEDFKINRRQMREVLKGNEGLKDSL